MTANGWPPVFEYFICGVDVMQEFRRMSRLPPYVFSIVNKIKMDARHRGEDIVDFGMGNPDIPTPKHIVDKLIESAKKGHNH
jgi:alanine-synthesizing transaminase